MLWLDIGAFCGYRRKMEIAESSLQHLVTVQIPRSSTSTLTNFTGITSRRQI